jgi:DNA-binding transcriptional regulator YiaG
MKSPITGKEMRRHKERRQFIYRKNLFDIIYQYYECEDSKEKFTDEELDNLNLKLVHNQYRAKYGIPFTDEIREIRMKYELSAAKMSEVLGLGANVYRNYEAGEMPSVATGRLIRIAQDPLEFRKLLELSRNVFDTHEFDRVQKKVDHSLHGWGAVREQIQGWLFENRLPDVFNGYRVPSVERTGCMVKFFAHNNKPFTTAMNKLMFYADFGHFKQYGNSISGITYKAIQKGPVPSNYGSLYNEVVKNGFVEVREIDFDDFVG